MLRIKLLIILFIVSYSAFSQWSLVTQLPSSGRAFPFTFSVDGKAYLGCGFDSSFTVKGDCFEFDPTINLWTEKSVPPFIPRMGAFSFSIGCYGYIGSGSTNGGANILNDLWRYDPINDLWLQMEDFPGVGRIEAATFVINQKAYIVSGVKTGGYPIDCWEYDSENDTWANMNYPPIGFTPGYVVGFSYGEYGYVGIGGQNGYSNNDFWRFDPISNSWIQLASLPSNPMTRTWATGGIGLINNKGFIGLGGFSDISDATTDFWIYDFDLDQWQLTSSLFNYPYGLINARTFNIDGKTYLGTGQKVEGVEENIYMISNNANTNNLFLNAYIQIRPNPFSSETNIETELQFEDATLTIYNCIGSMIEQIRNISGQSINFKRGNLPSGIYFIYIESGDKIYFDKFVITEL